MERLPYIDVQEVVVDAEPAEAWPAVVRVARSAFGGGTAALGRVLGVEPGAVAGTWSPEPAEGASLVGFAVGAVRPGELLSLRGRHRFSRYQLDLEVAPAGPGRSFVRARTWATFPGPAGAAYRLAVIGSHGHALVVRRMLRRIAALSRPGGGRS